MRKSLTEKNRQDLKNQCKMGLSISIMAFMFATLIGITVYEMAFDVDKTGLNAKMDISIAASFFLLAAVVNFVINHKYYSDLRTNQKVLYTKKLEAKSKSIDSVGINTPNPAKGYFNRFEFEVDNVKFLVDEELFASCEEGDELILSYASKSKYFLGIEKKQGK